MNSFPSSELILNKDGSVYHLNLLPNDVSEHIITVGDPERVDKIAGFLKNIRVRKRNREFYTVTGQFKGKEISVISTGIGTDNIDIVFNELNVLSKIDLKNLKYNEKQRKLFFYRLGTSGTLREEIKLGSMLISEHAIGLEGLMNFYPIYYNHFQNSFNEVIKQTLRNDFPFINPYVVSSSENLNSLFKNEMIKGVTATCQGFYHPQGRFLWSENNSSILECLRKITFEDKLVTNFEMETSGILGLAQYFGHEATSISLILANRITNEFIENGENKMNEMISLCLEKISSI